MKNLPIKKFKAGNIEAAIWENKRSDKDGNEVEFKTVSLTKTWKKSEDDVWRNDVIHLKGNEIQKAILVLQKAQEELLLKEERGDEDE